MYIEIKISLLDIVVPVKLWLFIDLDEMLLDFKSNPL